MLDQSKIICTPGVRSTLARIMFLGFAAIGIYWIQTDNWRISNGSIHLMVFICLPVGLIALARMKKIEIDPDLNHLVVKRILFSKKDVYDVNEIEGIKYFEMKSFLPLAKVLLPENKNMKLVFKNGKQLVIQHMFNNRGYEEIYNFLFPRFPEIEGN